MVIGRQRAIALGLGFLGARRQFLAALLCFGLGVVACCGLAPLGDALGHRALERRVIEAGEAGFHFIRRSAYQGAADGLGLEEVPQIGGFDIEAERSGLRCLAQCLGQGQHQCQHRNQHGYAFVGNIDMAVSA